MPIIDEVRMHVETDLNDEALGRVISDAVTEVEARFGTDAEMTVVSQCKGQFLKLLRPALSVSDVSERRSWISDPEVLTASDYEVVDGGRILVRLGDCKWAGIVTVVYDPVVEIDVRDRVVLDLVRLELSYNGAIKSEKVGDYNSSGSQEPDSYQRERENLLAGVSNRRGFRIL